MAKKSIQQPVTRKEEEAASTLMSALANIGQIRPLEKDDNRAGPANAESNRRSRFFFSPTLSFTEDVELRKKISVPKEIEIVDKQIEARRKTFTSEFPPRLNRNIREVREFWLREIAPLTLAAQSGSEQARDVVQRTLDAEIDGTPFVQFSRMIQNGTTIKLARYITKYLGLPPAAVADILDSIKVHRPQREVVYMNTDGDRRARTPSPDSNLTPSKESNDE